MKYAGTLIFLGVFAASLLVQWSFWHNDFSLDESLWREAAHGFGVGTPVDSLHPGYGYPATTLLLPAGALIAYGMEDTDALRAVMMVLLSLLSACVALVAYLLRPHTWWWLFAAFVLVFETLYRESTPPAALMAPLVVLFSLLALRAYEEKTKFSFLLFGICGGLMLATRFETSVLIVGMLILFLRFSTKTRAAFFIPTGAALLVFFLLDPYLWSDAMGTLRAMMDKVFLHAYERQALPWHDALREALQASFFGLCSFLLALYLLCVRRLRTLPGVFVAWMLAGTSVVLTALAISHHHPSWVFYAPLIVWEVMLPLLLFDLFNRAAKPLHPLAGPLALTALFIGAYAFDHLLWLYVRF